MGRYLILFSTKSDFEETWGHKAIFREYWTNIKSNKGKKVLLQILEDSWQKLECNSKL
jgi:hypothetical protein